MNHAEVYKLLEAVAHDTTVVVKGSMGIGKSSLFAKLKENFPEHHPFFLDCTQVTDGSLFMPDVDRVRGVSTELINERLNLGPHNNLYSENPKPLLICFDEIGKMGQYYKNLIAPIVYERRLHNWYLPKGSIVFCTTNLDIEGLGDDIQPHLKNRLLFVRLVKPTATEFLAYEGPKGLHPLIYAAVSNTPQCLLEFDDEAARGIPYIYNPLEDSEQENFVTPRSLKEASKALHNLERAGVVLEESTDFLTETMTGAVGAAFANVITRQALLLNSLPTVNQIVNDPLTTEIPEHTVLQLMVANKLVWSVNDNKGRAAALVYLKRLHSEVLLYTQYKILSCTDVGAWVALPEFSNLTKGLTGGINVIS